MSDIKTCDVCGQRVRIEGNTTRYCVPMEAETLNLENQVLREALKQANLHCDKLDCKLDEALA